jgi:tetratricopeptide (TPR) repeat protein
MSLESAVFANIRNDDLLQIRSQAREMTSGIDELDENAVDSVSQSQRVANERPLPTTSVAFLEQVRVNSRQQAAEAAYNLSIIAANSNDLILARTHIEEAIQLNHSNTNYLTFAADIAFIKQDYEKAEEYQLRVLGIIRSARRFDDLQVAVILDQLGYIYVAQELYEEAESRLQESLQLREKILGESHLQIVLSLNKLASLAVHQERPIVAESLLKRSLDIAREVSGPRHANSATMLANLADLYLREAAWQRFDDARLQFEQVVFLLKQNYRQDHPYVQQAIRNLTALDAERGNDVEQERMYDELVRVFSKHYVTVKSATP